MNIRMLPSYVWRFSFSILLYVWCFSPGSNFVSILLYVWCYSPGSNFVSIPLYISGASPQGRNFVSIENGDEVSDLWPVLTHLSLHGVIPKRKSRRMQHAWATFLFTLKIRLSSTLLFGSEQFGVRLPSISLF